LSSSPANTGYNSSTRTATVTKSGTTVTATLSFTAAVPTFFLGILGHPTISLTGQSTSSYTLPSYIDFYLMLDVSGSMGMPSTTAEMTRLQSVNPDNFGQYPSGCTFACHFTAQGALRTIKSRANSCRRQADEPVAGRILSRIHHFATGNDPGSDHIRYQFDQRQQGQLDQSAG